MTTKQTHAINLGNLTIDLTIVQTDSGAVELTDDEGNTKYLVDGSPVADSDDRYSGEFQKYGTFAVSIESAAQTAWAAQSLDARKAAGGATDSNNSDGYVIYTFTLSGQGNVVLLGSTSATDVAEGTELDVKVKVYAADGSIEFVSQGTQYFAVRANNEAGAEYDGTEFTTLAASFESTKLVKEQVNTVWHYYALSNAIATNDGWNAASHASEEVFLHSADKIHIE